MNIHSFYSFSKLDVGSVLSSRAVARQVLSPLQGFTTVFGMGTGGLPAIGHQQTFRLLISSILNYFSVFSAWAIEDCFVRFAFATLTTALIKCFVLSSPAHRRRIRTSHRPTESEKALVRLVMLG